LLADANKMSVLPNTQQCQTRLLFLIYQKIKKIKEKTQSGNKTEKLKFNKDIK